MNHLFTDGEHVFAVPLKCGYTAFYNAEKAGRLKYLDGTDKLVIAVVRQPVPRLLSFFKDKALVNPRADSLASQWLMRGLGLNTVEQLSCLTFSDFLAWLKTVAHDQWDDHCKPLSTGGTFDGLAIGRMLDIDTHSDWLFDFLKIDRNDETAYNKSHGEIIVTDSEWALINELYAPDIEWMERYRAVWGVPEIV